MGQIWLKLISMQSNQDLFSEFMMEPPPQPPHPLPSGKRMPTDEKKRSVSKKPKPSVETVPVVENSVGDVDETWNFLGFQNSLHLTMCPACRHRFWSDPQRFLLLRNGEIRVGLTLCRDCVAYGIEFGKLHSAFMNRPTFDNQQQQDAYHRNAM